MWRTNVPHIDIKCVFADVNAGVYSIYAVGEYQNGVLVAGIRQKKNFIMYGCLCGLDATTKEIPFMVGVV